jgi:hypothetical protein
MVSAPFFALNQRPAKAPLQIESSNLPSRSTKQNDGEGGARRLLLLRGHLGAHSLVFLFELGSEFGAEVLGLEYLTNLDL